MWSRIFYFGGGERVSFLVKSFFWVSWGRVTVGGYRSHEFVLPALDG